MKDNDIIKAYGCCNLNYDEGGGCDNCPCQLDGNCIAREDFDLEREVYNLLNRQKAEIERKEKELEAFAKWDKEYQDEIYEIGGICYNRRRDKERQWESKE